MLPRLLGPTYGTAAANTFIRSKSGTIQRKVFEKNMNPMNLKASFPGAAIGAAIVANTPKMAYFGFKDKVLMISAHICKVQYFHLFTKYIVGVV
jgi:hypothetical protein